MSGPFVIDGSTTMREGESRIFSVIWEDFTSVNASTSSGAAQSSISVEGYVNGSSDTANLFAGAPTAAGNTLTLPTLTIPAGLGGTQVVVEPHMESNSQIYKTGIVISILKPGASR